jgi:hypothetical protein
MRTLVPRRAGWPRALVTLTIVLAPLAAQVVPAGAGPSRGAHQAAPAALVARMVARDDPRQWRTLDPTLPSTTTVVGGAGTQMLHVLSGAIVREWARLYTFTTASGSVAAAAASADPAAGSAAPSLASGPWQPPVQPSWVATGVYSIEPVNKKGFALGAKVSATTTEQHTGVQVTQETTDQGSVNCPAADGTVTGQFEFGTRNTVTAPASGSSASYGASVVSNVTGRVGDNARLIDYDLTLTVTLAGDGHLVNQQTGQVSQLLAGQASITYTFTGLKLGERLSEAQLLFGRLRSSVNVSGPIDASQAKISAQTLVQIAQIFVDEQFQRAQRGWDEDAECLPVKFTPDPLQLAPGASDQVSVGVTSRLDGQPVDIELTATPPSGGSVAPATARTNGATADFRVTAPREKGSYYQLVVEGVSRRGRARGYLALALLEPILVYAIVYTGSAQYTRDDSLGDGKTSIRAHFNWASRVVNVQFNKQLLAFPGVAPVMPGSPFRVLDGYTTPPRM